MHQEWSKVHPLTLLSAARPLATTVWRKLCQSSKLVSAHCLDIWIGDELIPKHLYYISTRRLKISQLTGVDAEWRWCKKRRFGQGSRSPSGRDWRISSAYARSKQSVTGESLLKRSRGWQLLLYCFALDATGLSRWDSASAVQVTRPGLPR